MKEGKVYYTSGEVARIIGVPDHQLRYWDQRGYLRPTKRIRGRRFYSREDLERARRFAELLRAGHTPKDAHLLLTKGPSLVRRLEELLENLRRIRGILE